MPVVTRAAFVRLARPSDTNDACVRLACQSEIDDDICAICMDPMGDDRVKTFCNHYFHGQCIVNSLQYKRRCPMCRSAPSPPGSKDFEEVYDNGMIEDVQDIIASRLEQLPTELLCVALRKYNVGRLSWRTKEDLTLALAEQLTYETDSEAEDEDDEIME